MFLTNRQNGLQVPGRRVANRQRSVDKFPLPTRGMNYIAVRGHGDPNAEDGEYKQAIGLLYGIAFTIKMSKKGDHQIDGYFDYVVPR